ncbi:hypothetical protein E1301_Tti008776 [Triplophysa tibetana]|uniref:Uncharacterized protein n=1 Tax=Triplophysa tibetana TaxID=1572043 RepID=A0A5A9NZP7_9TELE|nr:hypothetical protein E1301_Tti008776 [Triplophysa tibetana]
MILSVSHLYDSCYSVAKKPLLCDKYTIDAGFPMKNNTSEQVRADVTWSQLRFKVQAKPLLQLALADFLASAVLMGTVVNNFLSYDTLPVRTSEKLCNYGLPLSLDGEKEQKLKDLKTRLVPIIGYVVYVKTVTVMQATLTPANNVITYVSSAPDTARFCDSCILFLHITNDTCPTVAMSVSLQGFLNSIVYAWRRPNFRDAVLGERMPLMSYSQKAFFDQSLNDPLGH